MTETGWQVYRAFDPLYALLALAAGLAASVLFLVIYAVKGRSFSDFWLELVEIALVTAAGAYLSRAFLSLLSSAGGDGAAAVAFVWHFFLGVLALVPDAMAIGKGADAYAPSPLLMTGFVVGGVLGLYDALHRARNWTGLGAPTFLLDHTWGLALNAHGAVMMLINTLIGSLDPQTRTNDHVYTSGFCIMSGFAFTQGAVISNWTGGDAKLLAHERIHVWQNRIFGPLFLLYYVSWLMLFGALGLILDIAGALFGMEVRDPNGTMRRVRFGDAAMWFGYYDNPWEVWAYQVGGWRDPSQVGLLRWHGAVVIVMTLLTVPLVVLMMLRMARGAFGL